MAAAKKKAAPKRRKALMPGMPGKREPKKKKEQSITPLQPPEGLPPIWAKAFVDITDAMLSEAVRRVTRGTLFGVSFVTPSPLALIGLEEGFRRREETLYAEASADFKAILPNLVQLTPTAEAIDDVPGWQARCAARFIAARAFEHRKVQSPEGGFEFLREKIDRYLQSKS